MLGRFQRDLLRSLTRSILRLQCGATKRNNFFGVLAMRVKAWHTPGNTTPGGREGKEDAKWRTAVPDATKCIILATTYRSNNRF